MLIYDVYQYYAYFKLVIIHTRTKKCQQQLYENYSSQFKKRPVEAQIALVMLQLNIQPRIRTLKIIIKL